MPSMKITDMPPIVSPQGDDEVPIVQDNQNFKISLLQMREVVVEQDLSEYTNNVPFVSQEGTPADGDFLVSNGTGGAKSSGLMSQAGSVITIPFTMAVETVEVIASLILAYPAPNGLAYIAPSGEVQASVNATLDNLGALIAQQLRFEDILRNSDNSFNVDQDGLVTASELSAGNGFTGTGTYTNFEIVDGIIINAS